MEEQKTIYCPCCNHKVATYDGHSKINVISKCRKCRKRVVYHVETGETVSKPIPPRNTSSGVSFC